MEKMFVPAEIENHIARQLQDLVGDSRIPENYASCIEAQVEEIEHKSYDGFFPYTNGGFNLMLMSDLSMVNSSGYGPSNEAISEQIDKDIENSLQMALEQFVQDNEDDLSEFYTEEQLESPSFDDINYHDLYEKDQGTLAERLNQDYEYNYLTENSEFWYQFKVMYYATDNMRNESGEDEILFLAGVNLDYGYGRDCGFEITYEKNVPLSILTNDIVSAIISEMVESI